MTRNIRLCMLSTIIVLFFLSSPVLGLETGPVTGNQGAISFFTGGVGIGERAEMEKRAGDYNLKIILAAKSGAYLSRVAIWIYDNKGSLVLDAESAGPWFYVRLPDGNYTVKAVHKGVEKEKMVYIARGLQQIMFNWDVPSFVSMLR